MTGENGSYFYGLWYLVALNVALFTLFILGFIRPRKKREWRSMGATLAFFAALFTEMYGIPLTIYILVSVLGRSYPAANPFSFRSGHLWVTFLGGGNFMFALVHVINFILVISGLLIMGMSWRLIHRAKGRLVTGGPYACVRHPQYLGLMLIMTGMLILWPTIITALMFPVLILMYYRLAKREEEDMLKEFGDEYRGYQEKTPMFLPRLKRERPGRLAGVLLVCAALLCAARADGAGDPGRGAAEFRACTPCHSVEPGHHMSGPSLARVWGRKAGAVEGFLRYSDALKKSGLVWTEQSLDKWLEAPDQLIPGNEMAFPGVKEKKARQDIIAYLEAVSEGKAPPAEAGQGGMMGMMGGGPMPNLKEADAEARIKAIRYCRDTYFVTTAANQTIKFWEFNLRIKTDSGANGPQPGKPVLLGAGMMGDRASVVFAGPGEISQFIKQSCE